VLVHQGSADFGHYYAFIKNFVDGQWYKFNDENVQRVAEKHVVTERYSQMPGSPMRRGAYGVPVSSSAALGVRFALTPSSSLQSFPLWNLSCVRVCGD